MYSTIHVQPDTVPYMYVLGPQILNGDLSVTLGNVHPGGPNLAKLQIFSLTLTAGLRLSYKSPPSLMARHKALFLTQT